MSTHIIEIIEIEEIFPHENAEKLEIVKVFGWQCCVGKGQFQTGSKAIYVPPDHEVPTDQPEFSFLKKEGRDKKRITVMRLRGVLSQGLVIPVPESLKNLPVGSNVIEQLGITRYEPPLPSLSIGGNFVSGPSNIYSPKFDVESYQRYKELFAEGEEIVATEKIHGANARFTFAKNSDGEWKQFCGSRTNWIAYDEKNIWWQAFKQYLSIEIWCQNNPEKILYGEVFGNVQALKYGARSGQVFFAAFAILDKQTWLDYDDVQVSLIKYNVSSVPFVCRGPFNEQKLLEMAERDSLWITADHLSEGLVIIPVKERTDPTIGRVCLKIVSNRYLEGT